MPPIVPEVEATPGPSGFSLLAAVESMDGVENVTVVEDNNDINENITVENSSIENVTKLNVVKDNVEISDLSSQESGSMECSDSPDISSFSSSTEVSDSLDQFLCAARKRPAPKRAIIPSAAVAAASIVKRSKAVPGAGVQKKKGK